MAQRVKPHFNVLVQESGHARILLEPVDDSEEQVFKRSIVFDLVDGTTVDEANNIADYLRVHLIAVSESE